MWIFDYLLFCEHFACLNDAANVKKKKLYSFLKEHIIVIY